MDEINDFQNPVQNTEQGSVRKGAIKNSFYNTIATFVSKIGGLIFTVVLARLLLPELFGIYNLVLSITLIAMTFTDLGIGKALVRYTSEALGKGQRTKARAYVRYLFRARITLVIIVIFLILVFGKFISERIFDKPEIFLPLLFSVFYILMKSFEGLVRKVFVSLKELDKIPFMQLSLQTSRIVFAVIAILLISDERFVVSGVFIGLGLAAFLSFCTGLFFLRKNRDLVLGFGKLDKSEVNTRRIWNYIGLASIATVSLKFFGSIDTLMLGGFVDSEFLGFYRAAMGLVVAITGIFAFSPVLLPIFTQSKNKQLQKGFDEVFRYLSMITIPATIGVLSVANYFIYAVYGGEYLVATIPLSALAFTIIIKPFTVLYSS
ncbi:MAG: oligosaccharide flippase family protein, partial [Minisyncoccales bacterium]